MLIGSNRSVREEIEFGMGRLTLYDYVDIMKLVNVQFRSVCEFLSSKFSYMVAVNKRDFNTDRKR